MRRILLSLVLLVATSAARAQGTGALEGTVRDSTGKLLPGALVAVTKPVRAVLTDVGGRFRLDSLPSDTIIVSVQHAGYAPANFAALIPPNTTVYVAVKLVSAQRLGTVVVSAERRDPALARRGFYDRAMSGMGKYYGPDWMETRHYDQLGAALREVPLMQVKCRGESSGDCVAYDAAGCVAPVWIDGIIHYDVSNINMLLQMQDVKAMEVYRRASELPAELQQNGRGRGCGAIVLWTRFAR